MREGVSEIRRRRGRNDRRRGHRGAKAVEEEEAAAAIRVFDFQGSPPWLVGLEREGLSDCGWPNSGGGLRCGERCGGATAEWVVGDN
jgi:hypothetical protein